MVTHDLDQETTPEKVKTAKEIYTKIYQIEANTPRVTPTTPQIVVLDQNGESGEKLKTVAPGVDSKTPESVKQAKVLYSQLYLKPSLKRPKTAIQQNTDREMMIQEEPTMNIDLGMVATSMNQS